MNNHSSAAESTGAALPHWMNEDIRPLSAPNVQASQTGAKAAFFFLCLFTIAVYGRPEDIFLSLKPVHLTFVSGVCAASAYLLARVTGHARFLWSRELGIILLLTGWYVAGLPFALWRGGSFLILTQVWLKTLLIFFLLTQTLTTVDRIRRLLWAIILSELVVTALSLSQSSRVIWVGERMHGVSLGILGWNYLGIAAAVTTPYIAALFIARRSFLRSSLLVAAFLSMMWMLMLTASRSGFLTVIFSMALTWLLVLRGSSRGRIVGVALALMMGVAVMSAPRVFWERIGTLWSTPDVTASEVVASANESKEDHLTALTQSLEYTASHPVFGLGLGNFDIASGTDVGQPGAWRGTHNTFTQVSSEAGIPALLLFVALLVSALRSMKRIGATAPLKSEGLEASLMARATLASLISFAFGAFFAHIAYEYYLFYPVAIAVGIQHVTRAAQPCTVSEPQPSNSAVSAFTWA
jgi:O-antigen ligase